MAINPANEHSEPEALSPPLQAKLKEYQKALEEEFAKAEIVEAKGENFEQLVRDTFKEYTPLACAKIVWLVGNADSEAISLAASKVVLSEAFKIAAAESDPIKVLIESLSKNPNSPNEDDAPEPTNTRTEAANKASGK